jgi:hypothetical protein
LLLEEVLIPLGTTCSTLGERFHQHLGLPDDWTTGSHHCAISKFADRPLKPVESLLDGSL